MELTHPEICSVCILFEDAIGLYGGHMLRLLALSINCDMLPMMSLASSLCVSVISDVVYRYLLMSVKIILQSFI